MTWQNKREEGMLTVEAVLSLVPFIMVILGIISFINIFVVHNKIQFALYQMGGELSGYTYFYQALGLRDADLKLKEDIDENTEELDNAIEEGKSFLGQANETVEKVTDFLGQIGSFENDLDSVQSSTDWGSMMGGMQQLVEDGQQVVGEVQQLTESGKHMMQTARDLISDPKGLVRGVVYLLMEKGESYAKTILLEAISRALISVYLDESFSQYAPGTADEYLKHYGVKGGVDGLDFSESKFFDDDDYRMIDIVVEYDIEVYFFKLFMKDPTIHVVQRCSMSGWLNGDGVVME